jgi:hypothetical protein
MKIAWLLFAAAFGAQAQPLPAEKKDDGANDPQKTNPLPPKPRPRITFKAKGGTGSNVGDDASGGGAPSATPDRGGTPGTPSGSFTGAPSKP